MNPEHGTIEHGTIEQRMIEHRAAGLEQTAGLEQQLSSIKRELRLYRAGLGIVFLAAIAAIVWGHAQPIPDRITAKTFLVVNEQGRPALLLGGENDFGVITLVNPAGKPTLMLASDADGKGGLVMFNQDNRPIAMLGTDDAGDAEVRVCDASGSDCREFTHTP